MTLADIVNLWYETQYGHHLKCREAQAHLSKVMQKLYEEKNGIDEDLSNYQCTGDEPI